MPANTSKKNATSTERTPTRQAKGRPFPAALANDTTPSQVFHYHAEQEGYLVDLVAAADSAAADALGGSETLYRVSRGEEAYPDPEASAKAVMALAREVQTLHAVVNELCRMVLHRDIKSDSQGLPR